MRSYSYYKDMRIHNKKIGGWRYGLADLKRDHGKHD
jgi:N-acetyl-gamma-glutamylphosphate reductase